MAKKLVDLFKQIATKAGLTEDPALTAILANEAITTLEVPDEFYNSVDNRLLSLTSALDGHPEIKNKYTALALSPMDEKINSFIDSLSDLDDNGRTALKGERSTYKRFDNLVSTIKTLESKKAGTNNDQDKVALQKKIDKLHGELQAAKGDIEKVKTEYEGKLEADKKDYRLRGLLGNVKTTMDTLNPDVRNDLLLGIINKHLQGNGLVLKFDEKGELQPFNSDGSKAYGANHTVTTMPALIDSLLAQNKLLPVTNSSNGQQSQNSNNNGQNNNGHTIIDIGNNNNGQGSNKINGTNQAMANMNLATLASLGEKGN